MAELSTNRTGEKSIQVDTENGEFTFICSRSPQNLEFGNFTLLCGWARWMNKKLKRTCRGPLLFSLNPIVLSRCRCRRRRHRRSSFLNSLVCGLTHCQPLSQGPLSSSLHWEWILEGGRERTPETRLTQCMHTSHAYRKHYSSQSTAGSYKRLILFCCNWRNRSLSGLRTEWYKEIHTKSNDTP